jgi:hypothetical protein
MISKIAETMREVAKTFLDLIESQKMNIAAAIKENSRILMAMNIVEIVGSGIAGSPFI